MGRIKESMPDVPLNIGIIVPSNNRAGPQKLAALGAIDLSMYGHRVYLFIPRLPYFYYFVTLRRDPVQWIRLARHYVRDYIRDRSFSFQDILTDSNSSISKKIHIKNVWRTPAGRKLKGLDAVWVMTIAQVVELESRYPQEKTIYQIHHPDEIMHGQAETFQRIRSRFKGKIVAISPWTVDSVSDHIGEPPVVPDVISPQFWEKRYKPEQGRRNRDILFHFSFGQHKGGDFGEKLVTAVRKLREDITVTVWTRDNPPASIDDPVVRDLSENELRNHYLSHKMLLFPSVMEGFGMPPIEAMACGCLPILNAGVGASDLYAQDNRTALFIDPDIHETAKKIVVLLDDMDRMSEMQQEAYHAIKPFSPHGYGMRILKAAGVAN